MAFDEQPTKNSDGSMLNGCEVTVEILAGPHAKKQCDLMLWNPKPTDKNGGELAKRRYARFFDAVGILPQNVQKGQKVQVDPQKSIGRQFIATLEPDDNGFPQFNFADIWHVDDPAAPKCELNQDALSPTLYGKFRRKPESFSKQNGSASGGATKPATQPAGAGAVSQTNNLDDL